MSPIAGRSCVGIFSLRQLKELFLQKADTGAVLLFEMYAASVASVPLIQRISVPLIPQNFKFAYVDPVQKMREKNRFGLNLKVGAHNYEGGVLQIKYGALTFVFQSWRYDKNLTSSGLPKNRCAFFKGGVIRISPLKNQKVTTRD